MDIINNDRTMKIVSVVLSVVFGVLFISLIVDAATTISGTLITLENGETISNSTDTVIRLGDTTTTDSVQILGIASTSALMVGDEVASTINGLVFGYCTINATADVTAASSTYANCTGATGVISGDRVFVNATGSIPVATVVTAASSTATAGTIQLRLHADAGATSIAANTVSLNFWAVR